MLLALRVDSPSNFLETTRDEMAGNVAKSHFISFEFSKDVSYSTDFFLHRLSAVVLLSWDFVYFVFVWLFILLFKPRRQRVEWLFTRARAILCSFLCRSLQNNNAKRPYSTYWGELKLRRLIFRISFSKFDAVWHVVFKSLKAIDKQVSSALLSMLL